MVGKISDMTAATALTGADFAAVQSGANVKVPISLFDAAYQPLDASLTAYAALTTAADKGIYFTAADTPVTYDLTSFARTLLDDANAAAARTTLGVVIGTDVQAYDAGLADIAALAVTDGNVIVGNGTNWVAESGATARTSLGLGTGDSPDFTAVTVGGNAVYSVGGTDVAIADGGTGAGTAAAAFTALKQAASDTATGVLEIADQSEMEAGSSATLAVTPGRQHFHPSAAKFWAEITVSGGTPSIAASYNVTSITDTTAGDIIVTIATDFSSGAYCALMSTEGATSANSTERLQLTSATRIDMKFYVGTTLTDPAIWMCAGYGDQ